MSQWYPAIAMASGILVILAGGWLLFGRFWSNSSLQEPALDSASLASPQGSEPAIADSSPVPSSPSLPKPIPPAQKPAPVTPPTAAVKPSPAKPDAVETSSEGILRVSNATDYPVRVALLLKNRTAADAYELPAHWDFEPGEGGARGLLLSLPNRTLRLSKGDVLVAFAQDGSRRYWGPYVVGETPVPTWDAAKQEWQLVLQP